jgi:ligand-binding SRPBCC domain-containing protein
MRLVVETWISAGRERVFDLARDVDAHVRTSQSTDERAVAPGRTTGLLDLGDLVTFEGVHLGVRQRLTARVVQLARPTRFVDEQVHGAFKKLQHVHEFEERDGGTLMRDTIEWTSPWGPLGMLADHLFLRRHLRSFISTKQAALKRLAEERV